MRSNKIKNFKGGFTLLELLVVVAIVGILSTIVFMSVASARAKSIDSLIQQNLKTVQTQAEIFFQKNKSYVNSESGVSGVPCTSPYSPYTHPYNNLFRTDPIISKALIDIVRKINNTSPSYTSFCGASSKGWVVAIRLKSSSINNDSYNYKDRYWCVDSSMQSKEISGPPSSVAVYEGFFPLTYKCP